MAARKAVCYCWDRRRRRLGATASMRQSLSASTTLVSTIPHTEPLTTLEPTAAAGCRVSTCPRLRATRGRVWTAFAEPESDDNVTDHEDDDVEEPPVYMTLASKGAAPPPQPAMAEGALRMPPLQVNPEPEDERPTYLALAPRLSMSELASRPSMSEEEAERTYLALQASFGSPAKFLFLLSVASASCRPQH